jgi:hypothetical protein
MRGKLPKRWRTSTIGSPGRKAGFALLDAKVDAKFTQFSWMLGVNTALILLVVGLVLRLGGLR